MSTPGNDHPAHLLPWYLNGTLNADERQDVESWVVSSPQGQADLQMWQAVRQQARVPVDVPADELAWRRLKAKLPVSRAPWWQAAIAAGVLLVAGLQVSILNRDAEIHRPLGETPLADQWRLTLRFQSSVSLADVESLLNRYDAQLVSGPSALGLYTVAVPRSGQPVDKLLERLRAEAVIVEAAVSP